MNDLSPLEQFCLRFPQIGKDILTEVNNESLMEFKQTSQELSTFLEDEKLLWIRKIRKYKLEL